MTTPPADGDRLAELLETGDGAELDELLRSTPREALAAWVRAHGGRRLSRRSRSFWARLLEIPVPQPPQLASALWPLA